MAARPKQGRVNFDDLTLFYQPQVSADGTRIVAAEALLRVVRPRPRMMTPADVLQRYNSATEAETLDWWVIERACRDALAWPEISVAINVTADRFRDRAFPSRLVALTEAIGIAPQRIELEVIESAYIHDFEAAFEVIQRVRAAGFRVAIDDFGTGYSSLAYLLKLPFDKLKIDKSFIDGVGSMQSAAIVHAICALARALGLKITAEGVETQTQYQFLKLAGCHYMQGWLFYKAVDRERLTELVRKQASAAVRPAPPLSGAA